MQFRWSLGIGDPTIVGWVTVSAYLVTSLLCYRASRFAAAPAERRFWLILSAVLLALGLNKQLDLQTLGVDLVRTAARAQGWYAHRRLVQALFIVAVAAAAVIGALRLERTFRQSGGALKGAIAGLVFILAFLLVRAASFHHLDAAFRIELGGFRSAWILELIGVAAVAASAWSYGRIVRSRDNQRS